MEDVPIHRSSFVGRHIEVSLSIRSSSQHASSRWMDLRTAHSEVLEKERESPDQYVVQLWYPGPPAQTRAGAFESAAAVGSC